MRQGSFIFLVSIRVIQCARKCECFLKVECGQVPLCEDPLVKNEPEFRTQIPVIKYGHQIHRFHCEIFFNII